MEDVRYFYRGKSYRESLLNTSLEIANFISHLEDRIMEITMCGEMKSWSDSVPDGETHTLEREFFEGVRDINVAMWVNQLEKIEFELEWFLSINNISRTELESYIKLSSDDGNYASDSFVPNLPF